MSERNVPHIVTSGEFKRLVVNGQTFLLLGGESTQWTVYHVDTNNEALLSQHEQLLFDIGSFYELLDAISAAIAWTNSSPSKLDS